MAFAPPADVANAARGGRAPRASDPSASAARCARRVVRAWSTRCNGRRGACASRRTRATHARRLRASITALATASVCSRPIAVRACARALTDGGASRARAAHAPTTAAAMAIARRAVCACATPGGRATAVSSRAAPETPPAVGLSPSALPPPPSVAMARWPSMRCCSMASLRWRGAARGRAAPQRTGAATRRRVRACAMTGGAAPTARSAYAPTTVMGGEYAGRGSRACAIASHTTWATAARSGLFRARVAAAGRHGAATWPSTHASVVVAHRSRGLREVCRFACACSRARL